MYYKYYNINSYIFFPLTVWPLIIFMESFDEYKFLILM